MKIILFSPYSPALDTSACARQIYDKIKFLRKMGHAIYLFCFCSEADRGRIVKIAPYCAEVYVAYLKDYLVFPKDSKVFARRVASLCNSIKIDLLQCENSYMSRYIPLNINLPMVLVEHEVLSRSFYERARFERMIIRKIILYLRSVKKSYEERAWYRRFARIIVFTDYDRSLIKRIHKLDSLEVVPLGIDVESYPYFKADGKEFDLIFAACFSHCQNNSGIIYFLREILPLVRKKSPNVSVMIAGSTISGQVRRLSKFYRNIHASGYVDDIRPIYLRSRVAIVPIYSGSGMRYKILEAWVMQLPVVSTSIGARGFLINNAMRIADKKEDFAAQIIDLLLKEHVSRKLGLEARKIAEESYDWADTVKKYDHIYSEVTREYKEVSSNNCNS